MAKGRINKRATRPPSRRPDPHASAGSMQNESHVSVLLRSGVSGWNRRRKDHPFVPNLYRESLYGVFSDASGGGSKKPRKGVRANLAGINLSHANLAGAFLEYASLNAADLTAATLEGANLTDARLVDADLSGANLRDANLRRANLSGAKLLNANLMYTQLNGANLEGADLTNCNVYGVSAWNIRTNGQTIQSSLRVENYNEPIIKVDDLELAQFIHLLLNRDKLRNVINAMTSRGVLLLGRFGGGGLEILNFIAVKLREKQYIPIIFDFERPADRNYTETVKVLVGLARFVIVDLSGPSVPQELYATVPHYKLPFVPILEKGRSPYAMFKDILEYPWVKPLVCFDNLEDLAQQIPTSIIEPAERGYGERQALLEQLYART
jgi:uncharacterized protein YjbI with pentapeptide repeats